MKAQRGVRFYLYSFFNLGARWWWMVKATPHFTLERDPVPIVEEAGWVSNPV
jgi:hypothetical protein